MSTGENDDADDQPMIPEGLVPRQRSDDPIAADDPAAAESTGPDGPREIDDHDGGDDDDSIGLDELP